MPASVEPGFRSTLALPRGSYPGAAQCCGRLWLRPRCVRCRCTNANQLPHCDIGAKTCLHLSDMIWQAAKNYWELLSMPVACHILKPYSKDAQSGTGHEKLLPVCNFPVTYYHYHQFRVCVLRSNDTARHGRYRSTGILRIAGRSRRECDLTARLQ